LKPVRQNSTTLPTAEAWITPEFPCAGSARRMQSGSVMEATAREVVELASADYELSDVSDRQTDIPVPPSLPPLDLDTTQVVPKLVLSELRYQARLRSNAAVAALDAKKDDDIPVDVVEDAAVPVAEPAPIALADAAIETIEETPTRSGMRGAVATGVAIGLGGIALVAGVLALVY
jgi:hypothetical protein